MLGETEASVATLTLCSPLDRCMMVVVIVVMMSMVGMSAFTMVMNVTARV